VIEPCRLPSFPYRTLVKGLSLPSVELRWPEDLLYRHIPVERLVTGEPHHARPAAADDSLKPIPPGDYASWLSRAHPSRLPSLDTS